MARTSTRLQTRLRAELERSGVAEIDSHLGLQDTTTTGRAAYPMLPVVLDQMADSAQTARGSLALHSLTQQLGANPLGETESEAAAKLLFGERLDRIVEDVASRAGMSEVTSLRAIRAIAAWVLVEVGSLTDDPSDPRAISRVLDEHSRPTSNPASTSEVAAASTLLTTAPATDDSASKTPVGLIAAGVAGLVVVGGLLFALLGGAGSDGPLTAAANVSTAQQAPATAVTDAEPQEQATVDQPTPAPVTAQPDQEPDEAAVDTTVEVVDANTALATDPTLTHLQVPLRDITGSQPEASGTIDFMFNTLSGEICFEVGSLGVNPPYAAHIHAGDFGIKGGVVADLGLLENNQTGCIDNLTTDTAAILAAPSRHYAELHDASGDWTVRGQLSERPDKPGIVPFVIPMRDILGTSPNSSGVLSFDFNTLTGQVCYSVFSVGVEPPYSAHIHAGPFGIKGGVVLDMGGLDTGSTGCVDNALSDTLAILGSPSAHYAEIHDAGGEWTVRGQLNETVDSPGIVSLAVPMVDINNVEPSANGTLHFDFNTVTGEICYDVTATNITPPFNSHIHAGEFGVKGGVVLDLGGLETGSAGCVNNAIGDTLAVLADPSGHYAELHDAGGEWTIRGQLSEAQIAVDPNATNLLLVDTDGGGASVRLTNGIIYLDGNVDNQQVADELVASLTGVTGPIVNNLQVVAGSPVPSGRVVFGDNVFFQSGSDRISALPAGTVRAIIELAESRPDWVMSIVGHTDDIGSDVFNLELSLRRAEAIRGLLISQGMKGDNMRIRGAGETAPIASNATEAGRAQNRRIEFEFAPA